MKILVDEKLLREAVSACISAISTMSEMISDRTLIPKEAIEGVNSLVLLLEDLDKEDIIK